MKIQPFTQTKLEAVEEAPGVSVRWVISKEDGAPNFAMRVFDVEPGGASSHHSHDWEHEVLILQGYGVLKTEHGDTPFTEGMAIMVPPDEVHQFQNTGTEKLRFACMVPLRGEE